MARVGKQRLFVGQLHQTAEVHHAHLVAHVAHHCQVVRDEQIRQPQPALQVFHDVEHLRLHAHIQRRRGLITHQKIRLRGQRARDRDALTLAARELVRVFGHVQRAQADRLEQLADPLFEFLGIGDEAMLGQRLAHNVLHDPAWVQRRVRVLEDHLDAPTQPQALRRLEGGMRVLPVKRQPAPRRRVQAHQQFGNGTLATARFAHQRQCFAFFNVKTHAVYGMKENFGFALQNAIQPRR